MTGERVERVTAVIVTHYSPHEQYGELAPPSAGIVSETIDSATERIEGLSESDIDLFYFRPRVPSPESGEYHTNLAALCEGDSGVTLHSGTNDGLRRNVMKILDRVETPYLFFIEHDWEFLEDVDLPAILETMDDHPRVNDVRFNKYENVVKGWNTVVEPDPDLPVPMCKVSSFTNQPHISRTDVLREWAEESTPDLDDWKKALTRDPYPEKLSVRDLVEILRQKYVERRTHVYKYDDFEYFIDTKLKHLMKTKGFGYAHDEYGTYLYGPHASGPYVEHLGR